MRKLEVFNETKHESVEVFNTAELEQAIRLAKTLSDYESDTYTIELLKEVENGYNTIDSYKMDQLEKLKGDLEWKTM